MASQRPLTVAARNDVSLTVLPLTSDLYDMPSIRVTVEPGEGTGLRLRSQVMVDKVATILRAKAGTRIGRLGLSRIPGGRMMVGSKPFALRISLSLMGNWTQKNGDPDKP